MFVIGVITLRTFFSSLVCGLGLEVSVLRSPCLCLASDTLISPWINWQMPHSHGSASRSLIHITALCHVLPCTGSGALCALNSIFDFGATYCLLVYITCFPTYPYFSSFFLTYLLPYLSNIDSFETRPALFSGQVS